MSRQQRLVRELAGAISDGTPIAWDSLLSGARSVPERQWLVHLRNLNSLIASRARHTHSSIDALTESTIVAVSIVAAVQVVVSFTIALVSPFADSPSGWPLPQIALAIAFSGGAIFLLRARTDPRVLPLMAIFLIAAAAFCRARPASLIFSRPVDTVFFGVFPDAYLPACMWAFALQFPNTRRFTKFDGIARICVGASFVIASLFFVANIVFAYSELPWLEVFRRAQGAPVYWLTFTLISAAALTSLFIRSMRAPADERRRVKRFALGLVVGILPFVLWEIALYTIPGVFEWALSVPRPRGRMWADTIIISGFLTIPFSMAAAVTADSPFTLTGFLRRASQYALARATLTLSATLPVVVVSLLVYLNRDQTITAVMQTGWGPVCLALSAMSVFALSWRQTLLRLVDRAFSKQALDHERELAGALTRIRNARSRREVVAVIAEAARQVVGARELVILVPDAAGAFHPEIGTASTLETGSALLALAEGGDGALDVAPDRDLYHLLPRSDQDWLVERVCTALVVPVKRRDDAIVALLCLGTKRDGLPLYKNERWLFDTLAVSAAAVWESFARPATRSGRTSSPHDDSGVECLRCGAVGQVTTPCTCKAGTRVAALPAVLNGKFNILRRVGNGAMGIVYHAQDVDLGREVALKTLPAVTGAAIGRLRQEARSMALVRHDALAIIWSLEVWRDTPVLVMEYMREGTLSERLRRGPLSAADALTLAIRLADGLAAVHGAGLLHRDIKPSNIGLTEDGAAKLLDFGVAGLIVDAERDLAGTPLYWPPEAFLRAAPSVTNDLWALSLVLFESLTGSHPFSGSTRDDVRARILARDFERTAAAHSMQAELLTFFGNSLSPDPAKRHKSARELGETLRSLLSRALRSPSSDSNSRKHEGRLN